jgi:hypothetical protein
MKWNHKTGELENIPSVYTAMEPRVTGPQFREQLAREEEAKRLAPIRAAEAKTTEIARALQAEQRAMWSVPVKSIREMPLESAFVDLNLASSEPQTAQEAQAAYLNFVRELPAKGFQLSDVAEQRFRLFVGTQYQVAKIGLTPQSLKTMFLWLRDCFQKDEVIGDFDSLVPMPQPEPAPKPKSLDEILKTEAGITPESDQKLKMAVAAGVTSEGAAVLGQWVQHLMKDYGYVPTPEAENEIVNWFRRENRSWLDARSYDDCRRGMVRLGVFPNTMMTTQEVCDYRLRAGQIDINEYRYMERDYQRTNVWSRPRAESGI